MIPRYKDFCMGVNCGSNCLRHALRKSAPSSCRFEFANSPIRMNISSGSFSGATLFTDFRYSSSALCVLAERLSLLPRTTTPAAMSSRTHSPTPIHNLERTCISLLCLGILHSEDHRRPTLEPCVKVEGFVEQIPERDRHQPRVQVIAGIATRHVWLRYSQSTQHRPGTNRPG